MDERTLHPYEIQAAPTVRSIHCPDKSFLIDHEIPAIAGWEVRRLLEEREHCTLYLAEDAIHNFALIKIHHTPPENTEALKRISNLNQHSYLLPILECGSMQGKYYEISPYYPAGNLDGEILDPSIVMNVIIPQLASALHFLHRHQLLHNDIKPSNILWVEKNKRIVLGDYDTLTFFSSPNKDHPIGTKSFMAPEVLLSGFSQISPASDLCSMGITIISLLTGASPLSGKTDVQMRRTWMRGIPVSDSISAKLKILINGLIDYDINKRLTSDGIRHWMTTYGVKPIEEDAITSQITRSPTPKYQPIWFGEQPIIYISDLIKHAGEHWQLGCFLLEQKKISSFLRQFDLQHYDLCLKCENAFDKNEGLFTLLHTLSCSEDFYWYGIHYADLEDFVIRSLDSESFDSASPGAHFLRSDMLSVYLKNLGSEKDKIEFAHQLSITAQRRPELAITQLLSTMSTVPEFKWRGQVFHSLEQLGNWISQSDESLDVLIKELFSLMRFESWLTFINEGTLINDIRNDMKGISL